MLAKRKLEAVVALAILIMLIILLIILFKQPKPPATQLPTPEPEQAEGTVPEVNPASIPSQQVVTASTIARIFVERFGSYSSQSDFANVADIKSLATPSFQAELDRQVASLNQADEAEGYTGVSTIVISIKTVSESETAATFMITTQREDSVGTPGNTSVRYQDVEISLVKSGDDWLVDELTWQ